MTGSAGKAYGASNWRTTGAGVLGKLVAAVLLRVRRGVRPAPPPQQAGAPGAQQPAAASQQGEPGTQHAAPGTQHPVRVSARDNPTPASPSRAASPKIAFVTIVPSSGNTGRVRPACFW